MDIRPTLTKSYSFGGFETPGMSVTTKDFLELRKMREALGNEIALNVGEENWNLLEEREAHSAANALKLVLFECRFNAAAKDVTARQKDLAELKKLKRREAEAWGNIYRGMQKPILKRAEACDDIQERMALKSQQAVAEKCELSLGLLRSQASWNIQSVSS